MGQEEFRHETMIPAPAGVAAPRTIYESEDGILQCYGTTAVNAAPLTTAALYAPGCTYILVVSGASKAYLNTGTKASPSWTVFGSVA